VELGVEGGEASDPGLGGDDFPGDLVKGVMWEVEMLGDFHCGSVLLFIPFVDDLIIGEAVAGDPHGANKIGLLFLTFHNLLLLWSSWMMMVATKGDGDPETVEDVPIRENPDEGIGCGDGVQFLLDGAGEEGIRLPDGVHALFGVQSDVVDIRMVGDVIGQSLVIPLLAEGQVHGPVVEVAVHGLDGEDVTDIRVDLDVDGAVF